MHVVLAATSSKTKGDAKLVQLGAPIDTGGDNITPIQDTAMTCA